MRLILLLFFAIFSVYAPAQTIVDHITFDKNEGLKDREVNRVIRNQEGYFYIFMQNDIQRYDGRNFEIVDIKELVKKKKNVGELFQLELLNGGKLAFTIKNLNELFFIDNSELKVRQVSCDGFPIMIDGEVHIEKSQSLFKAEVGDSILSKGSSLGKTPKEINDIVLIDNQIYSTDTELNLYISKDEKLEKQDMKGLLISRNNTPYLIGYQNVYKGNKRGWNIIHTLKDTLPKLAIKDKKDNILFTYSDQPRFQSKVFVLDNQDSIHNYKNTLEVSQVFKDVYADDFFYKCMIGGHNGMHVMTLLREGSTFINKNPKIKKGRFGNIISGVAHDGNGNIIFVKESNSVYKYDTEVEKTNTILKRTLESPLFKQNVKLYYNPHAEECYSYGYKYDGKSNFYTFDPVKDTYAYHNISHKLNDLLHIDAENYLLGGWKKSTHTGYVTKYNTKSKKEEKVLTLDAEVRSLYFDSISKKYWIGTYTRMHIYDEDFNLLEILDKSNIGNKKLEKDHIAMTTRYNGVIVLGSIGGGIFGVDPDSHEILFHHNEQTTLTDNYAIGLIEDDDKNLWISTFNGLNVMDTSFQIIKNIFDFEGLIHHEFNTKAITKDNKGNIYFGSVNGLQKINPRAVLNWDVSYGIHPSQITVYNDNVSFLNEANNYKFYSSIDSLAIDINLPDFHQYPYEKQNITLSKNGIEEQIITNNKNTVILKNLEKGNIDFEAKQNHSSYNSNINLEIVYDYRPWLRLLLIIGSIILLSWIISRTVIKYTKKQEKEKTALNKRIAELQITSLQSQMNPHFIFNALGAIQFFIQTHDTDKADEYLSNFAMLMRQILESSKSKFIRLSEELKLLDLYIGLEKVRFEELFDYKITVNPDVDTETKIPPMILQPFIENAINHGLHNLKERKGQLLIDVTQKDEDHLQIIIQDNGIGRKEAGALRMKKHKSRGMQLVEDRLQTFKKTENLHIRTEIIDLEEKGKSLGTKVIVSIDFSKQ